MHPSAQIPAVRTLPLQCGSCGSVLCQRNAVGEPIIRTRGIVQKRDGLVLICPKCKVSVPVTADYFVAFERHAFPPHCGGTVQAIRGRP